MLNLVNSIVPVPVVDSIPTRASNKSPIVPRLCCDYSKLKERGEELDRSFAYRIRGLYERQMKALKNDFILTHPLIIPPWPQPL